jgi:hypothetical protein
MWVDDFAGLVRFKRDLVLGSKTLGEYVILPCSDRMFVVVALPSPALPAMTTEHNDQLES